MAIDTSSSVAVTERLRRAVSLHDLDALASCFAADFVNETPVHPARSFRGREQVCKNWAQIFAAVPDIKAELLRSTSEGDTVWTEWEMDGTRVDGTRHLMRGVSLFGVRDDAIAWVRFYLEPVEEGGAGIDAAVRETLGQ